MKWRLSSSASRPHSKDAKNIPPRVKQGGSTPASNVVRLVILSLIVPIMIVTRKRRVESGKRRRTTGRQRARRTLERSGTVTAPHLTPTMRDWSPQPSTSLRFSRMNAILALWLRRRRYVFDIPPSTLLLAMRNLLMMK